MFRGIYESANKQNSQRKDVRVPSFENLQARIRDFSYSRLSNVVVPTKQSEPSYSPYKAQGLQQKINNSLGPRTKSFNSGNKWRESISSSSPFKYVQSPKLNESIQKPQESFRYDSLRTQSEHFNRKQGRSLADIVQLNEIVALRNKIESSLVSRSQLTSTYVSELVKLAQSITTQLKND